MKNSNLGLRGDGAWRMAKQPQNPPKQESKQPKCQAKKGSQILIDETKGKQIYSVCILCFNPSSIYSWSIGHILEHEFFFQSRFGSLARQGSSSLIFDFQLSNSYPDTIPFLVKKCFKNNRKNNINKSCNFCY